MSDKEDLIEWFAGSIFPPLYGKTGLKAARHAFTAYKLGKKLTVAELRQLKEHIDRTVHGGSFTQQEVEQIHKAYNIIKGVYKVGGKLIP